MEREKEWNGEGREYGFIFSLLWQYYTVIQTHRNELQHLVFPVNLYWLFLGSSISVTLLWKSALNKKKECATKNAIIVCPGITDAWCADTRGWISLCFKHMWTSIQLDLSPLGTLSPWLSKPSKKNFNLKSPTNHSCLHSLGYPFLAVSDLGKDLTNKDTHTKTRRHAQ